PTGPSRFILAKPLRTKTARRAARRSPLAVAELVAREDVARDRELHRVAVERVLAEAVAAVIGDRVRRHGQMSEAVGLAALEANPAAQERAVALRVVADRVRRHGDLVGDG